jgi:Tetratricopeptide repeat
MRQGTCQGCGLVAPIGSFYSINQNLYCEPCSWKEEREARERGETVQKTSIVDGSVCARCKASAADSGVADFAVIKGVPLCPKCQQLTEDWPYPAWLKISLAALLVLLAVSLLHGRKYFHAGRLMYRGELLVEQGKFAEAIPLLREADDVAPDSDKASLLLARAALQVGDMKDAHKALTAHDGGRYEVTPEFSEVNSLWKRAVGALEKAEKASQLASQDGHAEEAASLMQQAAREYPELPDLALAVPYYLGGAAFERKDYDGYLQSAQALWRQNPQSTNAAANLAGALSCKYAATGEPAYRAQAEEMIEKARNLARGNKAAEAAFQEYSERLRYRLDSREVISKTEYDRRFRQGKDNK